MSRETAALLLQALQPLLLALITAAAAWAAAQIRRRTQDARITAAVDRLARGAEGVVADLAQHLVQDLKDPSKPGSWDRVAAQSARATAITRLRRLFPQEVAALEAGGAGRVEELLGALVERGVVAAKGSSLPPIPSVVPSKVVPVDHSGERGSVRLGAVALLLATALCIAGLGAVLTGCREPSNCNRQVDAWRCSPEGRPERCSEGNVWRSYAYGPCSLTREVCVSVPGAAFCRPPQDAGASIPANPFNDASAPQE